MWSNTKRNRVITVKNVSNDGEDDAYDTWLATITFLYWPNQGTEEQMEAWETLKTEYALTLARPATRPFF